jgi:hypothetical protein
LSDPAPAPAPIDVAAQRRRLMIMVAVDAVCFLVALAAIIGDLSFHIGWLIWVFGAAMLAGFGAQGWLIAGLSRKK